MMRGIPRIAVDKNLPVYGTNYTAKDVADLDHVCKWNPDNYGLNQSHPGAQAWYDAQLDLFASWGLDFLKVDDMQTPFHSDEIAAYHRAIAKAEAKYGRSIDLSLARRLGGDELRRLPARERPNVAYFRRSVGPLGRHLPAVRPPGPLGAVPDHRPLGRRRHGAVRAHRPARRTRRRPPIPPYAGRAEDTAGPMVHGA